jgi:hypothetical protein
MTGILENIQNKIRQIENLLQMSSEGVESLREELARLKRMEFEEAEKRNDNRMLLRE